MRRRRFRTATAVLLALAVHVLVLTALGWPRPVIQQAPATDTSRPLELSVVHIRPETPHAAARAAAPPETPRSSAPARASPSTQTAPVPSAPAAQPPSSAVASGPPDCEVEDLPLLTEAERGRCRDQIATDKARRLARGADEQAAKTVEEAKRAPPTYRMDADKEASFDAVTHPPPPLAPHLPKSGPGVACSNVTFPLLSGVDINPDLFAKKHKKEKPQHGHAICGVNF